MRSEGRPITAVVTALTSLVGGCGFERRSTPTSPSEITNSFVGVWASASGPPATELPSPESCTELEWHVTNQEGNTITGDFKGTCAGRGHRADRDGDRHHRGSLHRVERLRHGYLPSYPTMRLLVDGNRTTRRIRDHSELTTPARPAWARSAAPRSFRSNNFAHPGITLGDATAFSLAGKRNSSQTVLATASSISLSTGRSHSTCSISASLAFVVGCFGVNS